MSITAMKQALEALEEGVQGTRPLGVATLEAITDLRQAIEQAEKNQFNPDWDAMAVMVEEQQRMAKRIEELEQAEKQEPVAWESILGAVARGWCYEENANKTMDSDLAVAIAKEVQALYTTPQPQREWVGLKDEEIGKAWSIADGEHNASASVKKRITRAIEAKLKEKNT